MSLPALTIRHTAATIEDARAAWWQSKAQGDTHQGAGLRDLYARWQADTPDGTLWKFLLFMVEEEGTSAGNLYNTWDRQHARDHGLTGNLTELQFMGRLMRPPHGWTAAQVREALRDGLTRAYRLSLGLADDQPDEVDALSSESEVTAHLTAQGWTAREVRHARLRTLKTRLGIEREEVDAPLTQATATTRALLTRTDPTAPTAPREADLLAHQTLHVLAQDDPQRFQAAVSAAQHGAPLPGTDKPLRFVDWGKQHGHDYVTGDLPAPGEVLDGHHLPIGEAEARSAVQPHVIVFSKRARHIPQPGGPITAHSRLFTARTREGATYALLYRAVQEARYEAHIRQDVDPYPAHLSTYLTLPTSETT